MLTESNATINASQSCVVQENYFFEIVLRNDHPIILLLIMKYFIINNLQNKKKIRFVLNGVKINIYLKYNN